MYNNVLGVVSVRQKNNEYLYDVFCDVSSICNEIVVLDEDNILQKSEKEMISNHFDARILQESVDELDYDEYDPEWVLACYNDERPTRRFRYMNTLLFSSPIQTPINQWLVKLRFLWTTVEQYRVDYPWDGYEIPLAYRFIDEIDYKWDKGLIPCNQPGPAENCMLDLYSYRYLREKQRQEIYKDYLKRWDNYDPEERRHFDSLVKPEITVIQAVD